MTAASSKDAVDSLRDAEVLVVAPRFPSINQPWMDTYLEQLQTNGISFCVASSVKEPGPYQEKVDRLKLRDRTITTKLGTWNAIVSALLHCVLRPRSALQTGRLLREKRSGTRTKLKKNFGHIARALALDSQLSSLHGIRLIHCHSLHAGQHYVAAAKRRRLPFLLTFHGLAPPGVPQVEPAARQRIFSIATQVLVNTDFARRHVTALGCPPEKVTVLPQGLPLEDFPFQHRGKPAPGELVEILSVGRFQRDKGQAYSILSLKRLRDAGINAAWHFVGVGPDKPRLLRLAKGLGLEKVVTFHDGLSSAKLLALYHRCHLFVLASRDSKGRVEHVETQGVVLQEAQATGCIPIATRVGGIPECINHGIDGFLVRDGSHRAIATAVTDLVSRPDDWPELQRNARRNVEERFSASTIGKRMAELLRATMQEHRNNS